MKTSGEALHGEISRLKGFGTSKLQSDNLLIKNIDGKLKFSVSNRDAWIVMSTGLEVKEDDNFFFDKTISIEMQAFSQIISGMRDGDVEIKFSDNNKNFIDISSPTERYELLYTHLPQPAEDAIFSDDCSDMKVLVADCDASILKPIAKIISNLGLLGVDKQFKTIVGRVKNNMNVIFVTGTTLSTYECALTNNSLYDGSDEMFGFETKSASFPDILVGLVSSIDNTDKVTIMYDGRTVRYVIGGCVARSTYVMSDKPISTSINSVSEIKSNISKTESRSLIIKVPSSEIIKALTKVSVLIGKGEASKLTSYAPLKIFSPTKVGIEFKNMTGSYKTSMENGVNVQGLEEGKTGEFNMNVPIIKSIMSTIDDVYPQSVSRIELKETGNEKIYVQISDDTRHGLNYIIRLRK